MEQKNEAQVVEARHREPAHSLLPSPTGEPYSPPRLAELGGLDELTGVMVSVRIP